MSVDTFSRRKRMTDSLEYDSHETRFRWSCRVLSVRVVYNNNGRRIRDDEEEDKIDVEY